METEPDPSDSGAGTTQMEMNPSNCRVVTMEMEMAPADCGAITICPKPEQKYRSADWPLSPLTTTETKPPEPPTGHAPSDPAADTWMISQLQAPPPASCQAQLILVEQRGQTLPSEQLVIVTGQSEGRELFVIPSNQLSGSQLAVTSLSSPAGPAVDVPVTMVTDDTSISSSRALSEQTVTTRSLDVSCHMKTAPSSAPSWAQRLHSVEKLGDSYRGFCCSGAEVEAILLLHKQQTGCVFGTRQSPSLDKPATRLMWKSQYVPYDGIPFVNTGSRAVVMECQFGPRRKGQQPKKTPELTDKVTYKATCPARIYIKKVRKFPEFRVTTELTADRKTVRKEQEKAFQSLRNQNLENGGVIRFYLQLPTAKAHLYHTMDMPPITPPPPNLPPPTNHPEEKEEETMEETGQQNGLIPSRLHPRVVERIRQLVAAGHHQVYTVRKQLRRFVEKELFKSEGLPERHNQRFFPTINDIKNHIHESQKVLGLRASTAEWTEDNTDPLVETVTLTLTPAREDVDGSDCSPEAVQLFSSLTSLQPKIFAQLQGILQPLPPPTSPSLPLVINPVSFLQTPAGGSAGASGQGEKLDVGQQVGERTQQVVLQNGENIELQITDSADDREKANEAQVEVEEEDKNKKRTEREESSY